MERVEVLFGATFDSAVAKRYLDSVAIPSDPATPLKPKRKARAEDALNSVRKATGMDVDALRAALVSSKAASSDWFVHPTAMGPLLSRASKDGEDPAIHWLLLAQGLAAAAGLVLIASNRLGIPARAELVKGIDGCARAVGGLSPQMGAAWRELHSDIAAKAEVAEV